MNLEDFLNLRKTLPVIDVRSEGEFAAGHVHGAINIPILNNEERKSVGIDYKLKGQREAIMTGFRLVGPRLPEMIEAIEKVSDGSEILVHCWRGGMRSNNFCQFASMARIKSQSLVGGYKVYRQRAMESFAKTLKLKIIGGYTGSGKSDLLRALKAHGEQVIDLESLANHKGSAFGALMMPPQPTTEQFQNDLFEEILKLDANRTIWIEDESLAVGRIFLPMDLWNQMCSSPVLEVVVPKDVRIERLATDYGAADRNEFLDSMQRITKRLGPQNFKVAKELLMKGDMSATIDILLTYYDKAYQNGLSDKKARIFAQISWTDQSIDEIVRTILEV